MRVTRRDLIRSSACGITAALTSSRAWSQVVAPKRISITVFSARPEKVEQLRTLFRKMRDKPASDPASYFFQGAVHWLPDLSSGFVAARPDLNVLAEMFNNDPAAKQMLGYWEHCTHMGVKTPADFLLWHRAYLYYFERHARVTLGDPTFALPYWDYGEQAVRPVGTDVAERLGVGAKRQSAPQRGMFFSTGSQEHMAQTAEPRKIRLALRFSPMGHKNGPSDLFVSPPPPR